MAAACYDTALLRRLLRRRLLRRRLLRRRHKHRKLFGGLFHHKRRPRPCNTCDFPVVESCYGGSYAPAVYGSYTPVYGVGPVATPRARRYGSGQTWSAPSGPVEGRWAARPRPASRRRPPRPRPRPRPRPTRPPPRPRPGRRPPAPAPAPAPAPRPRPGPGRPGRRRRPRASDRPIGTGRSRPVEKKRPRGASRPAGASRRPGGPRSFRSRGRVPGPTAAACSSASFGGPS